MSDASNDPFKGWKLNVMFVVAIAIIIGIPTQGWHVDSAFYPLLVLMLGFPIASWAQGAIKKNGNGNGHKG